MGSLLEAGVHPADVVFYREGQGPKLCASLEESISQILAEDTQFLEDMEERGEDQIDPKYNNFSEEAIRPAETTGQHESEISDVAQHANGAMPAIHPANSTGRFPAPTTADGQREPAYSRRAAPGPAPFQVPIAPGSRPRLGKKAAPERQRAGGFVAPRPLQRKPMAGGNPREAPAFSVPSVAADMGQAAGPPDVPAGVFSFLGGKQITISSAAQQRAAALLQQIQNDAGDDYLDAPCMQLIAAEPARQEQMPVPAAEECPSRHHAPYEPAPAEESSQKPMEAIGSEAGPDHTVEAGREPAIAAGQDTLRQQMAEAADEDAHRASDATQLAPGALEGIPMSSWEETQQVCTMAVVPDTLVIDQPAGEGGCEALGECEPSNRQNASQHSANDSHGMAEHAEWGPVEQTQILDQPSPVQQGEPGSADAADGHPRAPLEEPRGEEVAPTQHLDNMPQMDKQISLHAAAEPSSEAAGNEGVQKKPSVPCSPIAHRTPSAGAGLQEVEKKTASTPAADVAKNAPEAAASDAVCGSGASQEAGEVEAAHLLHVAAQCGAGEGSGKHEKERNAVSCGLSPARTAVVVGATSCRGSQAGLGEHAGEEATTDSVPVPMERHNTEHQPAQMSQNGPAEPTGEADCVAGLMGHMSPDNDERQLSPHQGPHQPPATFSFATASGKAVPVSAAALAQAAALFGSSPLQQKHQAGAPRMFATGSGKPVHIAADKLACAQDFLGFAEEDAGPGQGPAAPADDCSMGVDEAEAAPSGWATGSGKKLQVDAAKLAAARALLSGAAGEACTTGDLSSASADRQGEQQILADAQSPEKKRFKPAAHNENDAAVCKRSMSPVPGRLQAGNVPASPHTPAGLAARPPELQDHPMTTPAAEQSGPGPAFTSKGPAELPALGSRKASGSRMGAARPPSSGLSKTTARSGGGFRAPRSKFATPMRKLALKQDMAKAGTPSRLQAASVPVAPRVPLHSLEGTLAGKLLASLPVGTSMCPQEDASAVSEAVLELDSTTATDLTLTAFEGVGKDGERLGHAEFAALLHAAGAEQQYASVAWVTNHFRWVVWKLACYERQFPAHLAGRMLTPSLVLDQLKYRYEREFGQGHRSVLKKVLEQDEAPQRPMVLCMAAILQRHPGEEGRQDSSEQRQVEVTDGWYSVRATLDAGLSRMLTEQKLRIGTKMRVSGSELTAGSPSEVLEASRSCFLHLHYNGCHRVAEAMPLGWTVSRSVIVPLGAVRPGGGTVSRTCVVVQRIFPALYRDRMSDGRYLRRTPRAKAVADRLSEGGIQQAEEASASAVAAEEREHCRQIIADAKEGSSLPKGALVYAQALMAEEGHADSAKSFGSDSRADHDRYQSMRQQAMQARREAILNADLPARGLHVERSIRQISLLVSAVLHREACSDVERACQTRAVIEVSNPDEDLERITEGSMWAVSDLAAPDMHRGILLLRASARSHWQPLASHTGPQPLMHAYSARQTVQLHSLGHLQPGHDFDCHGIVLGAGEKQLLGKQSSQWVFVADESCSQGSTILAIHLQAQPEAVDFLDGRTDTNNIITLMNLRMRDYDNTNCLWRADGDETTGISLHPAQTAASICKPGSRLHQLAAWAQGASPLLSSLRQQVERLLAIG
ncbi:hypothetical protein COCSUDRAFT_56086 [Coccomyxa subellipsoidea C-169]|uniref:BRCA2 OB1 domain-containing protein n=1 Tax=Coccomyxa subellipsoidea (strain C-169) TaxID=574566 RepID=I0YVH7_COCSC|nr:hypothetical protein COCSUDRAFT_56086 [Coccomyxa subellipsoidea C-169]EIE22396.1 hypothetical protein COCSUDRAFT_56086 [Coccomyxa subellipsoidea C-169]|eukprot:XP_005646940.1 hypothetical protein COCSUDRAFT_56086 [Coccomyxa subellipsoidea C-169]